MLSRVVLSCCWCQPGLYRTAWLLRDCRPFSIALKHCRWRICTAVCTPGVLPGAHLREVSAVVACPCLVKGLPKLLRVEKPIQKRHIQPRQGLQPSPAQVLDAAGSASCCQRLHPCCAALEAGAHLPCGTSCNQQARQCLTAAPLHLHLHPCRAARSNRPKNRSLDAAASRPSRVPQGQGSGLVVGCAGLRAETRTDSKTSSVHLVQGLTT